MPPQLVVGKHDALMAAGGPRTVPRADVAEVVVQVRGGGAGRGWTDDARLVRCSRGEALGAGVWHRPPAAACLPACRLAPQAMRCEEALNKSFDLVARGEGEGEPTTHWEALFDATTAGF